MADTRVPAPLQLFSKTREPKHSASSVSNRSNLPGADAFTTSSTSTVSSGSQIDPVESVGRAVSDFVTFPNHQ